jgi:trans-2,3-dihydro-3-hydroxyanthranilate isomerase
VVGPPPPDRATLATMLSLNEDDLLADAFAPQAISCGVPYLYVGLRDRSVVSRARLRLDIWERALGNYLTSAVFIFARGGERPGSDIRARMFAPGFGIAEDPATGSAAVGLGAYLAAREPRPDGTLRWVVEQGFEMGRPSILEVEADKAGGVVTATRVGGASVIVCEGTMTV